MSPNPYDLFGEIPVTHQEITDWIEANAPRWKDSLRIEYYIQGWNVAHKVRMDKLAAHPN